MAFDIKIGINRSERIALDKDFDVFTTLTGTLKAETSIVDPVIMVEADVAALNRANYMEIEVFGRYYFITNIRSIRDGLVEISAHCDVLSSFKTAIRGNSGIIKRQETAWNLYLNDGTFKVYQNPMVLTKEFPGGFNSFSFIMGVAGTGRSVTPTPTP